MVDRNPHQEGPWQRYTQDASRGQGRGKKVLSSSQVNSDEGPEVKAEAGSDAAVLSSSQVNSAEGPEVEFSDIDLAFALFPPLPHIHYRVRSSHDRVSSCSCHTEVAECSLAPH